MPPHWGWGAGAKKSHAQNWVFRLGNGGSRVGVSDHAASAIEDAIERRVGRRQPGEQGDHGGVRVPRDPFQRMRQRGRARCIRRGAHIGDKNEAKAADGERKLRQFDRGQDASYARRASGQREACRRLRPIGAELNQNTCLIFLPPATRNNWRVFTNLNI
jgi:hypothetical protein